MIATGKETIIDLMEQEAKHLVVLLNVPSGMGQGFSPSIRLISGSFCTSVPDTKPATWHTVDGRFLYWMAAAINIICCHFEPSLCHWNQPFHWTFDLEFWALSCAVSTWANITHNQRRERSCEDWRRGNGQAQNSMVNPPRLEVTKLLMPQRWSNLEGP